LLKLQTAKRKRDNYGSGHFGANRGERKHNGVDYVATAGNLLLSPVKGIVTKIGYPYSDDLSYRYVQVKDNKGFKHRFFYVSPDVRLLDRIEVGDVLGTVQDICARYPDGMTPHVHYEIKDRADEFCNPEDWEWDG